MSQLAIAYESFPSTSFHTGVLVSPQVPSRERLGALKNANCTQIRPSCSLCISGVFSSFSDCVLKSSVFKGREGEQTFFPLDGAPERKVGCCLPPLFPPFSPRSRLACCKSTVHEPITFSLARSLRPLAHSSIGIMDPPDKTRNRRNEHAWRLCRKIECFNFCQCLLRPVLCLN